MSFELQGRVTGFLQNQIFVALASYYVMRVALCGGSL